MHKVLKVKKRSCLHKISFQKTIVLKEGRFWSIELEVLFEIDNDNCNYFVAVQSNMTSSSQKGNHI